MEKLSAVGVGAGMRAEEGGAQQEPRQQQKADLKQIFPHLAAGKESSDPLGRTQKNSNSNRTQKDIQQVWG